MNTISEAMKNADAAAAEDMLLPANHTAPESETEQRRYYKGPAASEQQKAVADALEQPLFDDHSKGLVASLQADAEKLRRAYATARERLDELEAAYQREIEAVQSKYRGENSKITAEIMDIRRAESAVSAAVAAITAG